MDSGMKGGADAAEAGRADRTLAGLSRVGERVWNISGSGFRVSGSATVIEPKDVGRLRVGESDRGEALLARGDRVLGRFRLGDPTWGEWGERDAGRETLGEAVVLIGGGEGERPGFRESMSSCWASFRAASDSGGGVAWLLAG
jgi:hypothetical protein